MARLRRQNFPYADRTNHYGNASGGIVVVLILTVVIAGISMLANWGIIDDHNSTADARAAMNSTINSHTSTDSRMATAKTILDLDKYGSDNVLLDPANGSDSGSIAMVRTALEEVADTGSTLHLSVHHKTWDYVWNRVLPIEALISLLVMMLVAFLVYMFETDMKDEYLMDFPWRKGWPVLYVLVTVLPVGWLFYTVGAVRYWHALRTQVRPPAYVNYNYYDDYPGHRPGNRHEPAIQDAAEDDDKPRPKPPKFNNLPTVARSTYHTLRTTGWKRHVDRKLENIRSQLSNVEYHLREYGDSIKQYQSQRRELLATLKRTESAESSDGQMEPGQLDNEFDQILAMPGVSKVRVINDELSILLQASMVHEGARYDLGDWEIRVGLRNQMYTQLLRSGVKETWGNAYPQYRLSNGSFCLGSREYDINQHLNKGQILEAVELAVNTMQSINQADLHKIPQAFRKDTRTDDN